jgi:predicted RNA binding protein YcfA (HicA-like mRNA interferase family)
MPKAPRYNYREIIALLKERGFYLYRNSRGSHEQWARDEDRKIITVPSHGKKTLSHGVIKNILKVIN